MHPRDHRPTAHERDARFLSAVEPSLLAHPMVREAGRCPVCGERAPDDATAWRRRRVIETIVASETESFAEPAYGPVWEVPLPPFVGCGHRVTLPLPLRRTPDGRCYYARRARLWG